MFFRKLNTEVSGIEIDSTCIRLVTVAQKNNLWRVLTQFEVDLPPGLVTPSFNKRNIQDSSEIQSILQQFKKKIKTKNCIIGVSLPSESTKFLVKSFPKLPQGDQNIKDMIIWNLGKSLKIDLGNIDVRWSVFKNSQDTSVVLMIGLASKSVLNEYTSLLDSVSLIPCSLCSSDLSLFNFYSSAIPENGTVAWLGIFPESISLFVFKNGVPLFYKNIRKKLIAQNDADNIDMLLQYFMDENPDSGVDHYYLSSIVTSAASLENTLSRTVFYSAEYEIMSPFNQISINAADQGSQWQYAAAVGAAWSTLNP